MPPPQVIEPADNYFTEKYRVENSDDAADLDDQFPPELKAVNFFGGVVGPADLGRRDAGPGASNADQTPRTHAENAETGSSDDQNDVEPPPF